VRPPLIPPAARGVARITELMTEGAKYLSPADGFTVGGKR
jgi:4-hydroxy-tetrahydrodipicolinate synthase